MDRPLTLDTVVFFSLQEYRGGEKRAARRRRRSQCAQANDLGHGCNTRQWPRRFGHTQRDYSPFLSLFRKKKKKFEQNKKVLLLFCAFSE